VLSHGQGCYVVDVDGKRYLDLLAGIAVNTLGHGHPALVDAVTKQASQLVHVSNFFTSQPQVELAEALLRIAEAPAGSAVFFANSGTEAIEAAVKLSRRTGRGTIIAAENAFHGRTTGSPRAHLEARLSRAVRAPHRSNPARPLRRRGRPACRSRRRETTWRPWSSNRSRARAG
jgi:acetylornithine/succinyldiaminopimelate/putrescine aminotransferase